MRVLGIETSCDETGVALYDGDVGLLGHEVYSQIALHAEFGGVVPELASRDHVRKLAPMIRKLLHDLHLGADDIDGVAYTAGPGLAGAADHPGVAGPAAGPAAGRPAGQRVAIGFSVMTLTL